MDPITVHTGRAAVLRRSDVDTDQIIPADYCRLPGRSGFAKGLFARWRDSDPDFVLNDPAVADATVLLAGPRFGTGSSREHAVWALREWGFSIVIAPGFGDIFTRNALKNGLVVVSLPPEAVEELMVAAESDAGHKVTVDLVSCTVSAGMSSWSFEIEERARYLLCHGYDGIELTLRNDTAITEYESHRRPWLPRMSAERVS
ncbi:3-isopropylmalate dehydratase small subunit [Saccharomonospora piscinae]|uniref:3-isopropylmalate dehydratase small subunit n=1 Tax=Saccharomonospora piscinae TaxID=687388 RepID=A0A1V8ZYF7_SACPI|nr:3-isopropylmalate dehydratase small subunit [Saccharomonospora piscinae]OQO89831.1 3-isopropylmalate dehydratase small subunit [Saccharomonospora piscinae]TLW90603.1 3-isopropylmalate dehydratase small subunit [Saccharomonospora piscinae]